MINSQLLALKYITAERINHKVKMPTNHAKLGVVCNNCINVKFFRQYNEKRKIICLKNLHNVDSVD